MKNTIITFEDHGQDFLQWEIDQQCQVIDSKPFQQTIWSNYTVVNFDELGVGGYVVIVYTDNMKKRNPKTTTIKYPIEKIEKGTLLK